MRRKTLLGGTYPCRPNKGVLFPGLPAGRPPQLDEQDTDSEADISDNDDEAISGQSATKLSILNEKIEN